VVPYALLYFPANLILERALYGLAQLASWPGRAALQLGAGRRGGGGTNQGALGQACPRSGFSPWLVSVCPRFGRILEGFPNRGLLMRHFSVNFEDVRFLEKCIVRRPLCGTPPIWAPPMDASEKSRLRRGDGVAHAGPGQEGLLPGREAILPKTYVARPLRALSASGDASTARVSLPPDKVHIDPGAARRDPQAPLEDPRLQEAVLARADPGPGLPRWAPASCAARSRGQGGPGDRRSRSHPSLTLIKVRVGPTCSWAMSLPAL